MLISMFYLHLYFYFICSLLLLFYFDFEFPISNHVKVLDDRIYKNIMFSKCFHNFKMCLEVFL